ncbi:enoyl-CoA hydratase/isomerase family protein [Cupriavidus sp. UYPR2.512]|uniref:enoyl-CoA hydratase/isomerase family protein n=1 Tax=Cupriavidus sp. UYPR2.512 TaxID=1080187 RepID=UPI0003738B86|nr:enoyl-CoA hydratase-related protein [Cupriavidus sp. UYPR2.512]UIF90031.1 enoyl-CoA hydratase/isomerase family protein [Cupriavidus necator]
MTVGLHYADGVAVLTLDRPGALNALNSDMLRALSLHIDTIARSEARAVLVIGSGERAFCAGADIAELQGRTASQHLDGAALGQGVFAKLAALSIPTVAVIRGPALGGGLELAMSCSHRVAVVGAKLGLPEIKLGLIPGYGGTQRLPRLVGTEKAMELILSGRLVSADEALAIGLVDKLVEDGDVMNIGLAFLAALSDGRPAAVHLAREAVRRAATLSLEDGLRAEADLFVLATQTDDAAEGINAFLEKRAPRFAGR